MVEFRYSGNSRKAGVYKIINLTNNRVYIGSSKEFKERWRAHEYALRTNKHSNKFLQSDFNKCGTDVFVFEVVEIVEGPKETRLLKEEGYINQYFGSNCYNLIRKTSRTEGARIFSKHPEITRVKMSAAHKGKHLSEEHKEKIGKSNSGKIRSAETKKKISETHKQLGTTPPSPLGAVLSDEHKEKIRKGNLGKIYSEETREKCRLINLCRKHTEQTRKNMSDAHRGKRKPLSAETKKKLSETHRRLGTRPTRAYNLNPTFDNIFLLSPHGVLYTCIYSVSQFSKDNNVNRQYISEVIRGKRKSYKGWKLANPNT
jgi:group I intron endonuclease